MDSEEIMFFKKLGIDFIDVIGQGGYGTVYYVYSRQYKSYYALKSIPIESFNEAEIECLKLIDDPHIVSLYQYYKFEDNVYMLMEYCPNDLDKMIKNGEIKNDKQLQKLIHDAIVAVQACHSWNIAHCDIKPSNFFIDQYGRVKIGDFGLSTIIISNPRCTICKGTTFYMAPEIFQHKEYNPMISDIWSLGITIYMMATGCFPFYHDDDAKLEQIIMRGIYDESDITSNPLKRLISRCLTVIPAKRATLDELLHLFYFDKYKEADNYYQVQSSSSNIQFRPTKLIIKPKVVEKSTTNCLSVIHNLQMLRFMRVHMLQSSATKSD